MPSDVVGDRVRQVRKLRRLSVEELAERCEQVGAPQLTVPALYVIESGRRERETGRRRRMVTVDEWLALALALNVSPLVLLLPDQFDARFDLTAGTSAQASDVVQWIIGRPDTELSGGNLENFDLKRISAYNAAFPAWIRLQVKTQEAAEAVGDDDNAALRQVLDRAFDQHERRLEEMTKRAAEAAVREMLNQQEGEEGGAAEDQADQGR
ncbi:helix-turn-helix transcriptional regulator [Amycolatopsis cynarae]|uniref:Helix-turn-helix transcriptional regulator n=1 Tax=Amycolatopsis cynarae TaxID=2995223 RepID=A0ABY7B4F4_9PSEU|nr:helix-turn-helix transcriptional regulator [Amycolatopsis sp. HUAS 11-8]WAL67211.1 helix-turn-helix transcriptional regulator [Amycolatopsis sp. HUAS 11-8]